MPMIKRDESTYVHQHNCFFFRLKKKPSRTDMGDYSVFHATSVFFNYYLYKYILFAIHKRFTCELLYVKISMKI